MHCMLKEKEVEVRVAVQKAGRVSPGAPPLLSWAAAAAAAAACSESI